MTENLFNIACLFVAVPSGAKSSPTVIIFEESNIMPYGETFPRAFV